MNFNKAFLAILSCSYLTGICAMSEQRAFQELDLQVSKRDALAYRLTTIDKSIDYNTAASLAESVNINKLLLMYKSECKEKRSFFGLSKRKSDEIKKRRVLDALQSQRKTITTRQLDWFEKHAVAFFDAVYAIEVSARPVHHKKSFGQKVKAAVLNARNLKVGMAITALLGTFLTVKTGAYKHLTKLPFKNIFKRA